MWSVTSDQYDKIAMQNKQRQKDLNLNMNINHDPKLVQLSGKTYSFSLT